MGTNMKRRRRRGISGKSAKCEKKKTFSQDVLKRERGKKSQDREAWSVRQKEK